MVELNFFQILIISIWAFWRIIDALSFGFGFNNCIAACLFTGIVVGNPTYGLIVGGTLQLTQLGVGTYGGASVLNITSSGMIATALGATSGQEPVALAASIGILLATLFVQLDILARFANTAFQHIADRYVEEENEHGIVVMNHLGILPWGLSRGLPVFLLLLFGQGVVNSIVDFFPQWLMSGFSLAGGLLPVVGFAILLRYLPVSKKFEYLVFGFALAAYLSVPILGIALFAVVFTLMEYKRVISSSKPVVANATTGGGDDDYEE